MAIMVARYLDGYANDPYAQKLLQELSVQPDGHPPYSLADDIIQLKGRVWLGNNEALQQ